MIRAHLLHAATWLSLRWMSPPRTARIMRRGAKFLPALDRQKAVFVSRRLRFGSCLTRAITVSAQLPGSKVVLGVTQMSPFQAHAWVEVDGAPIDPDEAVTVRLGDLA
jgi:hypothetical protein